MIFRDTIVNHYGATRSIDRSIPMMDERNPVSRRSFSRRWAEGQLPLFRLLLLLRGSFIHVRRVSRIVHGFRVTTSSREAQLKEKRRYIGWRFHSRLLSFRKFAIKKETWTLICDKRARVSSPRVNFCVSIIVIFGFFLFRRSNENFWRHVEMVDNHGEFISIIMYLNYYLNIVSLYSWKKKKKKWQEFSRISIRIIL